MQLLEKTKVYFQLPIFKDIGDEKALEDEKALDDAICIAEMRMLGFTEGAIVVRHDCLKKEEPINWGVVTKIYEKWPELNKKFVPIEVKWFNAGHYGNNRYNPDDIFMIQGGPEPDDLKMLATYNENTTGMYNDVS